MNVLICESVAANGNLPFIQASFFCCSVVEKKTSLWLQCKWCVWSVTDSSSLIITLNILFRSCWESESQNPLTGPFIGFSYMLMKTWSQPPTWLQPSAFRHIDVLKATPWSSDRASECGWTCRRFLKAADLLGFSTKEKTSLPFTEKHPIKKKREKGEKCCCCQGSEEKVRLSQVDDWDRGYNFHRLNNFGQ